MNEPQLFLEGFHIDNIIIDIDVNAFIGSSGAQSFSYVLRGNLTGRSETKSEASVLITLAFSREVNFITVTDNLPITRGQVRQNICCFLHFCWIWSQGLELGTDLDPEVYGWRFLIICICPFFLFTAKTGIITRFNYFFGAHVCNSSINVRFQCLDDQKVIFFLICSIPLPWWHDTRSILKWNIAGLNYFLSLWLVAFSGLQNPVCPTIYS